MDTPPAPALTYFARIDVDVDDPVDLGEVRGEHRRIVPILGGTVTGPTLRGTVLPAGADFQILREGGPQELDARYGIETDEGSRIYVQNSGVRAGSRADLERIARGEPVDPERIYFRSVPQLLAAPGRWEWLNSRLFVANGERMPNRVRLHLFVIE